MRRKDHKKQQQPAEQQPVLPTLQPSVLITAASSVTEQSDIQQRATSSASPQPQPQPQPKKEESPKSLLAKIKSLISAYEYECDKALKKPHFRSKVYYWIRVHILNDKNALTDSWFNVIDFTKIAASKEQVQRVYEELQHVTWDAICRWYDWYEGARLEILAASQDEQYSASGTKPLDFAYHNQLPVVVEVSSSSQTASSSRFGSEEEVSVQSGFLPEQKPEQKPEQESKRKRKKRSRQDREKELELQLEPKPEPKPESQAEQKPEPKPKQELDQKAVQGQKSESEPKSEQGRKPEKEPKQKRESEQKQLLASAQEKEPEQKQTPVSKQKPELEPKPEVKQEPEQKQTPTSEQGKVSELEPESKQNKKQRLQRERTQKLQQKQEKKAEQKQKPESKTDCAVASTASSSQTQLVYENRLRTLLQLPSSCSDVLDEPKKSVRKSKRGQKSSASSTTSSASSSRSSALLSSFALDTSSMEAVAVAMRDFNTLLEIFLHTFIMSTECGAALYMAQNSQVDSAIIGLRELEKKIASGNGVPEHNLSLQILLGILLLKDRTSGVEGLAKLKELQDQNVDSTLELIICLAYYYGIGTSKDASVVVRLLLEKVQDAGKRQTMRVETICIFAASVISAGMSEYYPLAHELLSKVVQKEPDNDWANYYLAGLYEQGISSLSKDPQKAWELYLRVAKGKDREYSALAKLRLVNMLLEDESWGNQSLSDQYRLLNEVRRLLRKENDSICISYVLSEYERELNKTQSQGVQFTTQDKIAKLREVIRVALHCYRPVLELQSKYNCSLKLAQLLVRLKYINSTFVRKLYEAQVTDSMEDEGLTKHLMKELRDVGDRSITKCFDEGCSGESYSKKLCEHFSEELTRRPVCRDSQQEATSALSLPRPRLETLYDGTNKGKQQEGKQPDSSSGTEVVRATSVWSPLVQSTSVSATVTTTTTTKESEKADADMQGVYMAGVSAFNERDFSRAYSYFSRVQQFTQVTECSKTHYINALQLGISCRILLSFERALNEFSVEGYAEGYVEQAVTMFLSFKRNPDFVKKVLQASINLVLQMVSGEYFRSGEFQDNIFEQYITSCLLESIRQLDMTKPLLFGKISQPWIKRCVAGLQNALENYIHQVVPPQPSSFVSTGASFFRAVTQSRSEANQPAPPANGTDVGANGPSSNHGF